jgi:hypothetical protein
VAGDGAIGQVVAQLGKRSEHASDLLAGTWQRLGGSLATMTASPPAQCGADWAQNDRLDGHSADEHLDSGQAGFVRSALLWSHDNSGDRAECPIQLGQIRVSVVT